MDQHIQAYFRNRDDAEEAAISLRALGIGGVETDRIEASNHVGDPGAGLPFMATSSVPFAVVSGERLDDEEDHTWTVVLSAKVPEKLYDQAVDVVKQSGGRVD